MKFKIEIEKETGRWLFYVEDWAKNDGSYKLVPHLYWIDLHNNYSQKHIKDSLINFYMESGYLDDQKIILPYANKEFNTIEADFPWRYTDCGMNGFNGSKRWRNHTTYPCLPIEILHIQMQEVQRIASDNCHLYFWTVDAFLEEALRMLRENGFDFKQTLVWNKHSKNGKLKMLPGSYFRRCKELCLFAIKRSKAPKVFPLQHATLRESFDWIKPSQHSAKPDEFYQMVVDNSPGPRVSLFQRRERPGFASWGNELALTKEITEDENN